MNITKETKKRVEFTTEEVKTLEKSLCILQELYDILEEDSYVRSTKEVFDEGDVFTAKEVLSAFTTNSITIE